MRMQELELFSMVLLTVTVVLLLEPVVVSALALIQK